MNYSNEVNESQDYKVNLKVQITEKYTKHFHLYNVQKHTKLSKNSKKDNL